MGQVGEAGGYEGFTVYSQGPDRHTVQVFLQIMLHATRFFGGVTRCNNLMHATLQKLELNSTSATVTRNVVRKKVHRMSGPSVLC